MRTHGQQLTQDDIHDIVALHEMGIPKLRIAVKYGMHHSTIIYHINKYYTSIGRVIIKRKIPQNKTVLGTGEMQTHFVLKPVKSYKDYVEEEHDRMLKKRETCPHKVLIKTVMCKGCGVVHTHTITVE